MPDLTDAAAYGGPRWSPRTTALGDELGTRWARCGLRSEWEPLRAVLLHRPGAELAVPDPDAAQLLAPVDPRRAAAEHDRLADAYRAAGVRVHYVEPETPAPPNLMFCADLFLMTPEGAILARPASTVRAGEERWIARRLAGLGVPILRTVRGTGVFEGADAVWLDARTVLLGRGLRTNAEGARQVAATLAELDVEVVLTDLPRGAMHLMGLVRVADRDLAVTWPERLPPAAVDALRARGYRILPLPAGPAAARTTALNFVTLGPRRILMAEGHPSFQQAFQAAGIACVTTPVGELRKAAGSIGCLTGVVERGPAGP